MFLADGTSTGIITAEIMNWTGHVVTGPRSRLSELLQREETSRTGVYFLVGEDTETGEGMVYVGEHGSNKFSFFGLVLSAERAAF